MSNATPKGEMSAFQRWEMASFGDDRPQQIAEQLNQASAVAKINQLDLENTREAARREGNALGFQDGYAAGLIEGRNAGVEKIELELLQLQTVATQFSEQLAAVNQALGKDILSFALDLAQAMTKNKLEIDPETIVPILREAMECLPSVQQPAQINLHPDDALIIKSHMDGELNIAGWRIVSDSHIERGGCTLETAQNLIDATLATRWERLNEAIKSGLASSGKI
ncbi:MAG: flagellar assembly protein FliH [Cytophaga sp.]|nr:flagellar assembly protein FliH [Undibacterium sp.]